jgi:hypothetical protein
MKCGTLFGRLLNKARISKVETSTWITNRFALVAETTNQYEVQSGVYE